MKAATPTLDRPVAPAHSRKPAAAGRIAALDGIRGLAVIAVLVFHHFIGVGQSTASGGFLGVDVFFVLSGFLITGILLDSYQSTGRVVTKHFWERRARRLLPAVLVFLLLLAVYAVGFAPDYRLGALRNGSLATLFYVQNYWQLLATDIAGVPLGHTWTLSVEEQFYVIWPFALAAILWFARGRPRRAGLAMVGIVAASAVVMGLRYRENDPWSAYGSIDTRAHQLVVGATLAWAWRRASGQALERWKGLLDLLAAVGLAWLTWLVLNVEATDRWLYHGGFLAISLATAVVIAAAIQPGSVVARVLAFRPLVWVGTLSYGLYLFHVPINFMVSEFRFDFSNATLALVRLGVLVPLAVLSYRFVEQPVRTRRFPKPESRIGFWRFAAAAVVVAVAMILLVTRNAEPPAAWVSGQINYFRQAQLTSSEDTRVLVAGDVLALSLSATDPFVGPGVRALTASSYPCGLLRGDLVVGGKNYDLPPCRVQLDAFRAAVRSFAPHVVVAMFGSAEVFDVQVGGRTLTFGTDAYEAELVRRLDDLRETVTANGAAFILATTPCMDPPEDDGFPEFAALRSDASRVGWLNEVWARYAARHGDGTIDLHAEVCINGQRRLTAAGTPLSESGGIGFGSEGSREVWAWLAPLAVDARSNDVDAPHFDE